MMIKRKSLFYFAIFFAFTFCFCNACKRTITRDKAVEVIASLPEIKNISEQMSNIDKNVRLLIRNDSIDGENDQKWEFYVGEGYPDRTVFLMRIAVDKKSGDISIFDTDLAEYISLEEWRSKTK